MKTFTNFPLIIVLLCSLLVGPASSTVLARQKAATVATVAATQADTLVSIYPNPNKGIAKIKVNQPIEGVSKIRFSNTIGKVVKVVDLSSLTEGNEVSIDLTTLPAGVYFYSVMVNDKLVETKRLILEH